MTNLFLSDYDATKQSAALNVDYNVFNYLNNYIYELLSHDRKKTNNRVGAENAQVKRIIKMLGFIILWSKNTSIPISYGMLSDVLDITMDRIKLYKDFLENKVKFIVTKSDYSFDSTTFKYSLNTENKDLQEILTLSESLTKPNVFPLHNITKKMYNDLTKMNMIVQPTQPEKQPVYTDTKLLRMLCTNFLRGLTVEDIKNNIDKAFEYWQERKQSIYTAMEFIDDYRGCTIYNKPVEEPTKVAIKEEPVQKPVQEEPAIQYDFTGVCKSKAERCRITFNLFDQGYVADTKDEQMVIVRYLNDIGFGQKNVCPGTIHNDYKDWKLIHQQRQIESLKNSTSEELFN